MHNPSRDEIFILGNIGIYGILLGEFELAHPIVRMLQSERPDSAAGFIAEALQLNVIEDYAGAAQLLERSGALQADDDLEEAICLYLFSLFHAREEERACALAEAFLQGNAIESEVGIRVLTRLLQQYGELED